MRRKLLRSARGNHRQTNGTFKQCPNDALQFPGARRLVKRSGHGFGKIKDAVSHYIGADLFPDASGKSSRLRILPGQPSRQYRVNQRALAFEVKAQVSG
jgi:hypothetical protein